MPEFKFSFTAKQHLTASDASDALDFIAGQVRDGFTSGDANGAGWWDISGLKDDVFYQVDDRDGVLIIVGDDDPTFPAMLTSWDASDAGRTFMETMAEKLNEGHDLDYCKRLLKEELRQVRVQRLGYSWTDDFNTEQQRWTLTGPNGEIRLPSGGFHGWLEALDVATRDADRLALDLTPPE